MVKFKNSMYHKHVGSTYMWSGVNCVTMNQVTMILTLPYWYF